MEHDAQLVIRVPRSLAEALTAHAVHLTVQAGEPITKGATARMLLIEALERHGYKISPPDPATQPRRGRPPKKKKAAKKAAKR